METCVLFATDVHGSDAVFEQFCDAADSPLKPDVFIIGGEVKISKDTLKQGDSAEITDTKDIEIIAQENSDVLLIDIP